MKVESLKQFKNSFSNQENTKHLRTIKKNQKNWNCCQIFIFVCSIELYSSDGSDSSVTCLVSRTCKFRFLCHLSSLKLYLVSTLGFTDSASSIFTVFSFLTPQILYFLALFPITMAWYFIV